ncbi:unnamed protein product [Symbiodinium sp. CCMP2592]|nr:unnamed protein product [Symbiodinium sp. CCMP2592]CAE7220487.1 unnamed protein product [Symbiodinium sp. CCMP2592]CAE7827364.1 unnamed protein product [Symbiodinium sp. CCMP2592]
MDALETQVEEAVQETQVAESLGELLTCAKCKKPHPASLLLQKSKNSYLCKPCNRLSAFVSKLELPEGFTSLTSEQLVDFYGDVKKYTDERTGRLIHEKVSTAVVQVLEKTTEKSHESSEGGDFLPLSVLVMRGWDPELVKEAGEFLDHPRLGPCYKMTVLSESTSQKSTLKRKECTTVNLRAKKGKGTRALQAAAAAAGASSENGTETKQERRDRLKREAHKNKQLQKDFKKHTAAASKAVSELLPLLAKVSEETKSSSKAPQLLAEAQAFLAASTVGASLSFELLHVTTEATLLKNSLSAAKPKRAAKKAATKKPEQAEG